MLIGTVRLRAHGHRVSVKLLLIKGRQFFNGAEVDCLADMQANEIRVSSAVPRAQRWARLAEAITEIEASFSTSRFRASSAPTAGE
jgi:hypothetical protein